MASNVKSFSAIPENGVPTEIYTVPAGKTAIIKMLLASAFPGNLLTSTVGANVNGNKPLVSGLSLATNGSVKLLDDFVALNEGDKLYVENATPNASYIKNKTGLPNTVTAFMCNDAGNTFIAFVSGYGIFRSTDDCVTWTLVYAGTFTPAAWAYINGSFFFYTTASSNNIRKSADDGVTWTEHTSSNAPKNTSMICENGRIAKNGSGVYASFRDAQTPVYTSDGLTWNVGGSNIASGSATGLIWSGSYWVASVSGASSGVYYAAGANLSTWTAAANTGSLNCSGIFSSSNGINAGSQLVMAVTTGQLLHYSYGGDSYNPFGTVAHGTSTMFLLGTDFILGGNGTGSMNFYKLPIGDMGTAVYGTVRMHPFGSNNVFIKNGKIYGVSGSGIWNTNSLSFVNERKYGVSFHLSVAEI